MPKLSLRTKLILSGLLVLMPVLLLLIQNYVAAFAYQRRQIQADQMRVAQITSVLIDDAFDETMALAQSYATDPVLLSLDSDRINNYLARLAPIYPEYEAAVGVFDADGDIVGGSAIITTSVNVADREWFQDVMRTGEPGLTDVLISRGTGAPIVGAVAPLVDRDGRQVGVVVSTLDIRHLPEVLETVQRAPGQEIFLADRTGTLAFYTGKPELSQEERDASTYPPVQVALQGQVFTSEEMPGLFGDTRMVVATPTPRFGWVVGVSTPPDIALAPIQESLRDTLLVFAAVALFTIALAWIIAELFLRPLRQLTEHAIALGRGELQRRVKIKTGDELERLGDSFNAMADEVQRALRLREEFLSVASHELRTPLTIIKGYSQWLLLKEPDEDKRRAAETIIRQVDRISDLLDKMLTVSEIQAGRIEVHREEVDLAELIREDVGRMQVISEKHRLLFHAEGPVVVNVDPNQIEVVLSNLIDNAVRYSPKGGEVDITVSRRDDQAVVSVADRGMGIPKDRQAHVFEPFFQLQPAIAGFGGMGLGLYISKQIVENHGGRMWFESEDGKGSTFYFSLPAVQTTKLPVTGASGAER